MSDIKVTNVTVSDKQERIVIQTISGAPEMPRRFTRTQSIRPTELRLTFVRFNHERWQVADVVVFGPRILKGGREGDKLKNDFWKLTDAPEWVQELGTAQLDALNAGES